MPYVQKTWDEQVSTHSICTIDDIKTRLRSPEIVLNWSRTDPQLDTLIDEKYTLAMDWLRQDLVNYFQKKIPTNIKSMLAFKRSQILDNQQVFSRDLELADRGIGSWNYPTYGFFTFEGAYVSVDGYTAFTGIPLLRFNYGVPTNGTSGTFAGLAVNGDLLADMQYMNLYINRETDSPALSPVWDLFQASDAIDYLLNVSELKHAGTSVTLLAMAQDGMFRNQLDYQDPRNVDYKDFTIGTWRKMYKEDLERGLPLVNVDISGSGLMNDWKRGFTRSEVVICG